MASKPKELLLDDLPERMLDTWTVCEMIQRSRAELYIAMADLDFPKPIKPPGTKKNLWFLSEVLAWLRAQPRNLHFKGRRTKEPKRQPVRAVRAAQLAKDAAASAAA